MMPDVRRGLLWCALEYPEAHLFDFVRNAYSICVGICIRFRPESLFAFARNTHIVFHNKAGSLICWVLADIRKMFVKDVEMQK